MMQLNTFRDGLAPLMLTTSDAILNRQRKLHPLMRSEAPDTAFGTGIPVEATPTNAAMLILAALDNGIIAEIPERIGRLWRAHYAREDSVCPVTRAGTIGQALTALIEQPRLRDKLKTVDLAREIDTVSLAWKHRDRPSVFYPFTGREWRKRVVEIAERGPTHTASLAGSVFDKIAELIVEHRGR